jgi:hypothetical protein
LGAWVLPPQSACVVINGVSAKANCETAAKALALISATTLDLRIFGSFPVGVTSVFKFLWPCSPKSDIQLRFDFSLKNIYEMI